MEHNPPIKTEERPCLIGRSYVSYVAINRLLQEERFSEVSKVAANLITEALKEAAKTGKLHPRKVEFTLDFKHELTESSMEYKITMPNIKKEY